MEMESDHTDESRELAIPESRAVAVQEVYLPAREILERLRMVRELRDTVMEPNVHFGIIPGTEKPTLYQAGADLLRMMFNLLSSYNIIRDEEVEAPHRGYIVHTTLTHSMTGAVWGQGVGSCSTLEAKYRWRTAKRSCPFCHAEAIGKGKAEWGGGWYCNKKAGGCGARFKDADPEIMQQQVGRVENPDVADQYNTVLKMAKKRSFVDGILNATGAREKFSHVAEAEETDDDMPPVEEQRAAGLQHPTQPINPTQKKEEDEAIVKRSRHLFASFKEAGFGEAVLRDYMSMRFQKQSTKALSDEETHALLDEAKNGSVRAWVEIGSPKAEERTGK